MGDFFQLIRIKHWVKNLFIFLPAFFGGVLNTENSIDLALGWFCFSLVASIVYIINDLNDIAQDQKHSIKKLRPLAAGKYSKSTAILIASVLFAISAIMAFLWLPVVFIWLLAAYLVINICYSFGMKNISVLELLIVSSGFILRVISGAEIVAVKLSFWLLIMTFLFAFFIVVAKRRDDFTTSESTPYLLRKVNKYYSLPFLNVVLSICGTLLMVCYIMYTISSDYFTGKPYYALLSCCLVIVGLVRYFQAIFVEENGGSPTSFALKDRFVQITVLVWSALFYFLIYS